MSAPTPLAEKFIPCINTVFTVGTSPNTAVLDIIDGGLTISYGVDDMTNNGSGGAYEDVKTFKTVKGSFTATFPAGTDPTWKSGEVYPVTIVNGTDINIAGNFRFNDVEMPVLDIKAGVKQKFSLMGQGAITGC